MLYVDDIIVLQKFHKNKSQFYRFQITSTYGLCLYYIVQVLTSWFEF